MKTKEIFFECCKSLGGKNKKGYIIGAVAFLLLAVAVVSVAGATWRARHFGSDGTFQGQNYGRMMNRGGNFGRASISTDNDNSFVIPADASKSGEIAIIVTDLEVAKKSISDAAAKSAGSVQATEISYTSNNFKSGSIVVQVPVEKFDAIFGELKKIGSSVVQESTKKVAAKNDSQIFQDKGYIKVIFVDYGFRAEGRIQNSANAGIVFSAGGQDSKSRLILVLVLKTGLLLVLFVFLVIMLKRNFRNLREVRHHRKNKDIPSRPVKLQVKTRPKAVKTQRRKL